MVFSRENMSEHTASFLIPAPAQAEYLNGKLPVSSITTFAVADELAAVATELKKVFSVLRMTVSRTAGNAAVNFRYAPMTEGAWQMTIDGTGITAVAGDLTGASYAA
ncbi:MAG: hypothetical protein E7058_02480, partial [Lentisphaerae bacterium]|nr:hypothetical protein [Lentisphaerota bacterium]